MNSKVISVVFFVAVTGVVVTGCSSAATTGGSAALTQLSGAFCARASSCCVGIDSSSCPSNVSAAYTAAGFDTTQAYSSDSVNKCTSEIQALPCPQAGDACVFTVPTDCPAAGQLLPFLAADAGG